MAGKALLKKELTHYTDELFARFMSWVDNPDKTLSDNAGTHGWQGAELYSEMLRRDAHLSFLFRKRANAVTSLDWQIEAGGESPKHIEHRDFIRAMFDELAENGGLNTSLTAMHLATAYGYRPAELIYSVVDGKLILNKIKTRDPDRFRFNDQDQLIYVGRSRGGNEVMEPWKFMVNTWGSDESPYGRGLLRELYPLWFFKTVALKDFTRYLEKMGTGWAIGAYPIGTSTDEVDKLFVMLQEMQDNNVGVVPEGTNIDFKQAQHQGVEGIYDFIISYVDERYTLAILEQTTSTESESGTFALGRVQSKGEQRVIEGDAKWQEAQLNPIIRTLIDWNFGPMPRGEYPRFSYSYELDKDRKMLSDAIGSMVGVGVKLTHRWALEELGLPIPPNMTDKELDAPLEQPKAPDPFGGFGGGMPNRPPADETDDDEVGMDPGNMSERSARIQLAELKKKDKATALRISVSDGMANKALDSGLSVYERRQRDLIRAIKSNASLTEVINTWRITPAPEYLVAHHRDVLMTADLLSLSLMAQESRERGIAGWLAREGRDIPAWAAGGTLITEAVEPMGPGKAWAFFKDKVPMSRAAFDAQSKLWHDKAFSIAGLDNDYVVTQVKKSAEKALAEGTLMKDWIDNADELLWDSAGMSTVSPWHLETVYRTNVQGAVNGARWRELQNDGSELRAFFPDLEYVTAGDDAVRDEHAALDGLIYSREHAFWSKYYPPNGFNCRCIAVEHTVIEKDRGDYTPLSAMPQGVPQPEDGFNRPPA